MNNNKQITILVTIVLLLVSSKLISQERKIAQFTVTEILELSEYTSDYAFWYHPFFVRLGKDGEIFVADGEAKHIRCFSLDGDYKFTLGREGSGPGEFRFINDMDVTNDNSVWIFDPNRKKLIGYNGNTGKHFKEIGPTPHTTGRLTVSEDDKIWISHFGTHPPEMFTIYDINGDRSRPVAKMRLHDYQDDILKAVALQNRISYDGYGGVVIGFHWWGKFFRFDKNGNKLYKASTLFETPMAEVVTLDFYGATGMSVARDSKITIRDLKVDNNIIYILSCEGVEYTDDEDKRYSRYIDMYDLSTGEYTESIKLPNKIQKFDVKGNHIIGISSDGPIPIIYVWELRGFN